MKDGMDEYQNISNGVTNHVLLALSSGLSIIGSLIIIITYLIYKDIRTISRHIIICISISDLIVTLFNCLALGISPEVNSEVSEINLVSCQIQSFVSTTAILWSFLWTMVLAIFLYCVLVKGNKQLGKRIVWPWAHLLCWIVPLAINIVALYLGKLGNSGDRNTAGWCWINVFSNSLDNAKLWMFIDGKGIELLTYVVILVIYIRIKILLKRKLPLENNDKVNASTHLLKKHDMDAARDIDRKLILIPILLILLRIWGTVRFFMFLKAEHVKGEFKVSLMEKILIYLQTVGDNLQGAINCILFCIMTPVVRTRVFQSVSNLRRERFHLHDNIVGTAEDEESSSLKSPFAN